MGKCFLSSVILLLQSARPAWPVVPSLLGQCLANCHCSETIHVLIKTKLRKISLQYKLYFRWCVLIYTLGFFRASTAQAPALTRSSCSAEELTASQYGQCINFNKSLMIFAIFLEALKAQDYELILTFIEKFQM